MCLLYSVRRCNSAKRAQTAGRAAGQVGRNEMSKKTKFFVLLGLAALSLGVFATGCSQECVDDCDCFNSKGPGFICSNDNTCKQGTATFPDGGTSFCHQ